MDSFEEDARYVKLILELEGITTSAALEITILYFPLSALKFAQGALNSERKKIYNSGLLLSIL